MKKSLLALAVLGAFAGAAQAQSSVTVYGIIDTGVVYQTKAATDTGNASKFGLNSGVIQGSRIGFKGAEDLGGGLKAVFNLETGFTNDNGGLQSDTNSTNLFRRKSTVGLSGEFGTVLLGRQTDFADTISAFTSVADFGGVTGRAGHNLNRLEGSRVNNAISYTTNNLSGFTGSLLYGFGETAGKTSAGQSFNIGGKYENGPLGLGLNYFQSKQGATPSDTDLISSASGTLAGETASKIINLVASYQFGPARVYGNWSKVKQDLNTTPPTDSKVRTLGNSNKADVFELGTAYSLNPSLKLLASVQHTRASFAGSDGKGKLTQFNLGTDYWLSKRTDLYAFVSNIRASDMRNAGVYDAPSQDESQTMVAVGVRHKF